MGVEYEWQCQFHFSNFWKLDKQWRFDSFRIWKCIGRNCRRSLIFDIKSIKNQRLPISGSLWFFKLLIQQKLITTISLEIFIFLTDFLKRQLLHLLSLVCILLLFLKQLCYDFLWFGLLIFQHFSLRSKLQLQRERHQAFVK